MSDLTLIDAGRSLLYVAGIVAAFLYGILVGAVLMIAGIEGRPVRDNRPGSGATPKAV